jgi:Ca2+-binding RTX toxin-like protein
MSRLRIGAVVLLLTVTAVGTSSASPAAGQDALIGVWQGVDDADDGVVTIAVDENDAGDPVFFHYDSVSEDCDGQQAAAFGRGFRPDPGNPLWHVYYDGVYCLDGTYVPLQDEYFELILEPGGNVLNVLTPEQAGGEEPGGVQTYRVCVPDLPVPAGISVIMGTDQADTIKGTKGPDLICALGGDDTIRSFGGDDVIIGGIGADEVYGGVGIDVIWGGPDDDKLYGGFHTDGVFGNCDEDEVRPQAGHDFGYGGNEDDILDGFYGHDRLEGGPGDDDAWGRNGNDLLLGGTGNDFLSGGAGPRDAADGEAGSDTCNAETETNCEF